MKNNIPKKLKLLLIMDEGKTLEFKEKIPSSKNLIHTAIAFANTAGGKIVIGIKDKTKDIIGVKDIAGDEERIVNIISDSISPKLMPEFSTVSWRRRNILIIDIPYLPKPFYETRKGLNEGVYVRFGSSNRKVGYEIISEIKRHAMNQTFDEQVCIDVNSEAIDFRAASELFSWVAKTLDDSKIKTLNLLRSYQGKKYPTNGAVLLFGKNRRILFSDVYIRCVRFAGNNKTEIIDQNEIDSFLPLAVNEVIEFIKKHINIGLNIGAPQHSIIYEYPNKVVREAVINAIVHSDYSMSGSPIQIAIYNNRIEITNPGGLPFGLTMAAAMSGVSQLRNPVIGRVFRELGFIEQWGSGIKRMIDICKNEDIKQPMLEELGHHFRITLFKEKMTPEDKPEWKIVLNQYLQKNHSVTTRLAADLWHISDRAARTRLKKLLEENILSEIGTGPKDPKRIYIKNE